MWNKNGGDGMSYNTHIKVNPGVAGDASWGQVDANFEWLKAHIDDLKADIKMVKERRPRFTRTILCDGIGQVIILNPKDHENCKLISAFAQAADNIVMDNIIVLAADGGAIAKEVVIKAGEKSGKVQRFDISKHASIGRYEKVVAIPNSVRKVIVTTEFEEI